MTTPPDPQTPPPAAPPEESPGRRIPLRGPSGKFYGFYLPELGCIEVRRGGAQEPVERIDLRPWIGATRGE